MDLDNLSAQINATLIFSVYYGNLKEEIVLALMDKIVLLFGRDDAIKLDANTNLEITSKRKYGEDEIKFTVRKLFQLRIESEVFWTPF